MKHFVVTILFIILSINLNAQVVIYNAHTGYYHNIDKDEELTIECDLVVLVDTEKETISIDNKWDDLFYITSYPKAEDFRDDDGDKYTMFTLKAVDKDGRRVTVYQSTWEDYNITRFSIAYDNFYYTYTCNKLN